MKLLVRVLLIAVVLFATSCKSIKVISENYVAKPLPIEKVFKNYQQNTFNQQTVKAKIKVDYKDDKTEQSFIANLRMEKDKAIWITATVLGIPLVKALITPDKVSYYEKINESYFEGDFSMLSDWLGTSLDFQKVQNMLLGQPITSFDVSNTEISIDENSYLIKPMSHAEPFAFLFWLHPQHYKLNKQVAVNPSTAAYFSVAYKKYQVVTNEYFPSILLIDALSQQKTIKIELDFKSVEFNESVTFPFEIPNGYKPVQLN